MNRERLFALYTVVYSCQFFCVVSNSLNFGTRKGGSSTEIDMFAKRRFKIWPVAASFLRTVSYVLFSKCLVYVA